MSQRDVTVVVPARNAASTIGRAMHSAVGARVREVVLVDHACTDDTVAEAARHARHPLRVVPASAALKLGGVRQVGLDAVATPYATWLDADDEYLDGRVDRLVAHLEAGADLVADAAEVHTVDGTSRGLPMPPFLQGPGGWVRLFERNYLPGPGVIGFRPEALRRVGYDAGQHGPEDTDILLRALDAGARLVLEPVPGYRIHAHPSSLSRDLTNQQAMYRALLRKHDPDHVRDLYVAHGWSERVAQWALHSMALFVGDLTAAGRHLATLAGLADGVGTETVLEPHGPQPAPEGWRLAFARGTLILLTGNVAGARDALLEAERAWPTAEGANNLGVAAAREGDSDTARALFATALARKADYLDAILNGRGASPWRVTSHPFRHHDNRSDYSAA